ncbi:MAG: helix-turn-helix domain-containing protein [Bryobacteraceae bacterium]
MGSTHDTVSQLIRDRRKELEISREALADAAQCSLRTFEDMESGRRTWHLDRLEKVSQRLGCRLVVKLIPVKDTKQVSTTQAADGVAA